MKFTVAVCAALTAVHLGVRASAGGAGPAAVAVSGLDVGAKLPENVLSQLGPREDGACHLLVSLDPLCPSCKRAAQQERLSARAGWQGEMVWVAPEASADLTAFEKLLSQYSRALASEQLFEALDVRGVPALFVVAEGGEVRWVGPYRGSESEAQLAERCRGAEEP